MSKRTNKAQLNNEVPEVKAEETVETPVEQVNDVRVEDPELDVVPEVNKSRTGTVNRPIKIAPTKLTVTLKDGHVRVYSAFTHGHNWEILANNYAESQGGTIE